ncbi:hypothetical protein LVJ82_00470 [Vitreoscilla massiliensis]|uniref:Uncharacterized protein n=1 Tax=Vitreoscilla massiliensis TaxID=1689272 RepID=A0ABY4E1W5_9NEIS|nr:hypothetical protein [Vitreoscilla massiliensis]UOO89489.1 hypothetical protein LVJ82_00470 [Vitreoscilla massiliensis]
MSTNQSNRESWRKFLGIKDQSSGLESGRVGGAIDRTAGRSGGAGGGGSLDSDTVPEGEESSGAEKGDGAGDAGKQIKQGDKFDRLEDLYDCETGEKVKIDGLGNDGSEQYPTGFEDCKEQPTDPSYETGYYWKATSKASTDGVITSETTGYSQTVGEANTFCLGNPNLSQEARDQLGGSFTGSLGGCYDSACHRTYLVSVTRQNCSAEYNAVCDLPPPKSKWPAPDRNHLTWNKEKGCFEPLCPELNNQVLDKYKSCEKERILCDKDGNKVKVAVDGDTVKVTQAKYNQTAEIKDGKVQTVKKLTESQTEAEFK